MSSLLLRYGSAGRRAVHVSSVLDDNVEDFGKHHLIDGHPETCWNSAGASDQWIEVDFKKLFVNDEDSDSGDSSDDSGQEVDERTRQNFPTVRLEEARLTFQGGFVGKRIEFWMLDETRSADAAWTLVRTCIPEDTNCEQNFDFRNEEAEKMTGTRWKVRFDGSTDFYGRITMYGLELIGNWRTE